MPIYLSIFLSSSLSVYKGLGASFYLGVLDKIMLNSIGGTLPIYYNSTFRPDGGCEKECNSNQYLALLHTNNKG